MNLLFCKGKFLLVLPLLFLLLSCSDDTEYKELNAKMDFRIPTNFPALAQDVENNYPTQKGFELGRRLFYDAQLSADNTVSCSSCHEQAFAFTHHGHALGHGINDQEGIRNAPAVQNLAFLNDYFYDGASNSIEMLSINPIHNPVEMAETLEGISAKLKKDKSYVQMFTAAFDGGEVSSGNILKALGQFMTMMVSANSRYDKYVRNEPGGTMTAQELNGMKIFAEKCASCHKTDLFTDNSFRNNGLPPNPNLDDKGREVVTGFPADRYKFKVPSLRNAALTAPYMHDGRFGSLESVLNFYATGMRSSETLDPLLNKDGVLGVALSQDEKEAIIAFIKTLTDDEFVKNPLFYYKT
ncbi:cytochrome-c peroxidase [Flavobacterium hauense]